MPSLTISMPSLGLSLSNRTRRLIALCALCIVAMSTYSLATAQHADALSWQWRWYGGDALLNRNETNNLMLGYGAAAAGANAIPHPVLARVASAAFGLSAAYAGWVYNKGGCLKFRVQWNTKVVPNHYYGGACR